MARNAVVFPAPLAPINVTIFPFGTSSERPRNAAMAP